ncbi:uncharacterized protein LOC101850666 [Aplysia californica]|uniref:Uncharacterized protein LOC101850666 n=1 Tax=Aplysia californica TaxID=6500 RepID=A0ABM1A7C6_APLCA|nr:uncharacterized protein LOC101850666 [Aplysia californica]
MGGLSVLFSIIAINLHFRPEEETVPKIIRKVTRLGMFISCFNTCCKRKVKPEENGLSRTEHDSRRKYNSQAVDSENQVDDPLDNSPNRTRSPESLMFKPPWHRQGSGFGLRAPTGKFGQRSRGDVNDTDYARALSKVKGKSEEPEMTWQLVAKVMDAVLFRFYFLFLIVSTSVIMITLAA